MDDGESNKNNNYEKCESNRYDENRSYNASDVLQPVRFRYSFQNCFGLDRFFLENRPHFLFHFNAILFVLFILKFKK
jgi:hypothetical protein